MVTTLKDIAERVGVTESTVSRILNGVPKASKETIEKVFRVAEELNYTPNQIARSLVKQKTHVIGLVISDIYNQYFAAVTGGIEEIASLYEYSLIISTTGGREEEELKYINILKEKRVDGIIFMSGRMPESCLNVLRETSIPTVVVARKIDDSIPSIHIDNIKESYKAVEYLIELGHEKIAMISGTFEDVESGYNRFSGYKKALEDNGLPFREEYVAEGDFRLATGKVAMKRFLNLKELPTAIFAGSDEMAVGAIKAIKEVGLNVPDDISVVGFDNNIISQACDPELTTVGQPAESLGKKAMGMLYNMMSGERLEERTIYLPCELITRGSTRIFRQ